MYDHMTTDDALALAKLFGLEMGVVYDDVAGTLWERTAMEYEAAKGSDRTVQVSEGDELSWRGTMYTADEVGKLDGPGRYVNWLDMAGIRPKGRARTALGNMTKRERKAARKARRAAKRQAAPVSTETVVVPLLS